MNIIYMGTPEFAVPTLECLYNEGHNILLVITQKDKPKGRGKKIQFPPVKSKALELGLEVYQPDNINDRESIDMICGLNPDIIVVAAYGQILKKEILDMPKYGCINVHASLLPKYRGAAPINWVIINGEVNTGIAIMKMEEGLDTGDVILSKSIDINDNDDYLTIHDKLADIGGKLTVEAIKELAEGRANFSPQDDSKSSYAPMIYKETGHIDWNKSGVEIFNLVRGLKPWPIAYTDYNGENLKIHKVEFIEQTNKDIYGKIEKVSKDGIYVNVKDGYIIIKELQFPGKKVLTVGQYLAGNNIEVGIVLK
ncbi:methionyl-tRNA formyltransferase [Tissierella sp. Yu-01]|uniref:methionyl-tRNA formyltransferase n=1 Tax=Tissierella sp. Yu-01 TaxID=3035694 RepID=UPI00240E1DA0|nr:methionyl-tRNA formyltransferase [Tissierella sp. Yu-01]WFA09815.1 methionyl-tRNA formyltransferase [Tissierella sp. Yu-01]